jgi:(p)ppGpp synthase/HD superfamily hydrolase
MNLTEKALRIAYDAHDGQVRKSDNSPYIIHPIMVSLILKDYDFTEEVIAAALVHDVLEDTDVPRERLVAELGAEVVEIVDKVSEDTSLEWEDRKELYVQSVANASEGVKAVSIADKIHNAKSVINDYKTKGKDVWKPFNRGKEKKLWFEEMLYTEVSKEWSHPLLAVYKEQIELMKTLEE